MKRLILLIVMVMLLFVITSCTYDESYKLAATYDFENRQCNITNISKATDYKELEVTICLNGKDNFNKEMSYDIGTLKSGETYTADLSYISEDVEVSNIYIVSCRYYQNDFGFILVGLIVAILIVFVIVNM